MSEKTKIESVLTPETIALHRARHYAAVDFERAGDTIDLDRDRFMQGYTTLQIAYVLLPIITGVDKFTYFLTDWSNYVAPVFPQLIGLSSVQFLYIAGAIEICAGIGIAFRPRFFGYVMALWLAGIMINLFILGKYFDVCLRDFALAMGAYALARLTDAKREREFVPMLH